MEKLTTCALGSTSVHFLFSPSAIIIYHYLQELPTSHKIKIFPWQMWFMTIPFLILLLYFWFCYYHLEKDNRYFDQQDRDSRWLNPQRNWKYFKWFDPILEICFDNEFCVIFLRKKPNPHNKSCYVFLILYRYEKIFSSTHINQSFSNIY